MRIPDRKDLELAGCDDQGILGCDTPAVSQRVKTDLFQALFACAAQTLLELRRDARHLGAQLGLTAVLHTWVGSSTRSEPFLWRCEQVYRRYTHRVGIANSRIVALDMPSRSARRTARR